MVRLERELDRHYRSTLRAIDNGRFETAKRRLDAYTHFAETYLETASARGVKISEGAASSASFVDWPTPLQIARYAHAAIYATIHSQNLELISYAAYLPVRFLQMSVAHKPESTEGMGRCWSGWGSEGMGMAGTALIPTDRGWFVV